MKKKPAKAVQFSGGKMRRPAPAGKPAPRPVPAPAPGTQFSGGVVQGLRPAPVVTPAPKKKTVKRKLALGEAVACCAAEALAASLRLIGHPVSDRDVLALYELTVGDENEGATILATLEAAAEYGLGGIWPVRCREVVPSEPDGISEYHRKTRAGLILGLDLPGPHAVYQQMIASDDAPFDARSCWWSWGQPWGPADFPDAVIEEAWQVTWPS